MGKFRKSFLIFGILALVICAALGTFIVLSLTGSLKDEPIALEFTIGELHREYNGKPQRASKESEDCWNLVTMDEGYLIEGHTLDVDFTGERTDVGPCQIGLDVKVVNADGYDVTDQYKIKVNKGLLYVYQKEVNVKLTVTDVIYDGTAIDIGDKYTASGLVNGHRVALKLNDKWYNSLNNILAGKIINYEHVDLMIFDGNGSDVTGNYNCYFSLSPITILRRPLTISPVSAEKTYDGKPLTCSNYKIDSGSLVSGHYVAECSFASDDGESSLVNAGSLSISSIKSLAIFDINGNNVTENYALGMSNSGTLTVNKAPLTVTAKSASWTYDGEIHSFIDDNEPYSVTGLIGGEEITVKYSGSVSDIATVKNVITECYINGVAPDNYSVTLIDGNLEITKAPLTVTLQPIEVEYGGKVDKSFEDLYKIESTMDNLYLKRDEDYLTKLIANASIGNSTYTFNRIEILTDPTDPTTLIPNSNFNITVIAGNLSVTRRKVSLANGVILSKEYDGTYTFTDVAGIFANDALVNDHKVESVTVDKNGAILSVALCDGQGSSANGYYEIVNISDYTAELNISPRALKISTQSFEKIYDGTPQYGGDAAVSISTPLAYGDRIVTKKQFSVTDCNENAENKQNLPEYCILNSYGIDVTEFYTFDAENADEIGTISVKPAPLTVTLKSYVKEYGDEFVKNVFDLGKVSANVKDAENLGIMLYRSAYLDEILDSKIEIGSYEYTFDSKQFKIIDTTKQDIEEDCTANFKVTVNAGNISITKRSVTVNALNLSKDYDGDFTFTSGVSLIHNGGEGLVSGHLIKSTTFNPHNVSNNIESSIEVQATVTSVSLIDGSGKDVSDCYNITNTSDKIKLNITKKSFQVSTKSYDKEYDGISVGGDLTYFDSQLVDGDRVVITNSVSVVDSTSVQVQNKTEFEIYNSDDVIVSDFYKIVTNYGNITVKKLSVSISGTLTKVYDGMPFEPNVKDLEVSNGKLAIKSFVRKNDIINFNKIAQTQDFEFVEFIFADTGESVKASNVSYNSNVKVEITKKPLTVTLNTIYYPASVDNSELLTYLSSLDLSSFVNVSGLINDEIDYIEVDISQLDGNTASVEVAIQLKNKNSKENYKLNYEITGTLIQL